jgi:hypothetical protein
MRRSN